MMWPQKSTIGIPSDMLEFRPDMVDWRGRFAECVANLIISLVDFMIAIHFSFIWMTSIISVKHTFDRISIFVDECQGTNFYRFRPTWSVFLTVRSGMVEIFRFNVVIL